MDKVDAVFTLEEIAMLVVFTSKLDPDLYASNKAKALIYKSKDMVENPGKYSRLRLG